MRFHTPTPTPNAGLFGDVVSTLNPACRGAGPEVDGPLRDMPVAVFLLSSGGYRLHVVASSAGWGEGHAFNQCSAAASASGGAGARSVTSADDLEVCRRWSIYGTTHLCYSRSLSISFYYPAEKLGRV